MEVVGAADRQPQVRHPPDLLSHDMDHALLVLQAAHDEERRLEVDDEARLLEETRPDYHVREPRLVLDRDEAEAFRRARSLARDHGAANLHARAPGNLAQPP